MIAMRMALERLMIALGTMYGSMGLSGGHMLVVVIATCRTVAPLTVLMISVNIPVAWSQ